MKKSEAVDDQGFGQVPYHDPLKALTAKIQMIIEEAAGFSEGNFINADIAKKVEEQIKKEVSDFEKQSYVQSGGQKNGVLSIVLERIATDNTKKSTIESIERKRKKIIQLVERVKGDIISTVDKKEKNRLYKLGDAFGRPLTKEELIGEISLLRKKALELTDNAFKFTEGDNSKKQQEIKDLAYAKIGTIVSKWDEEKKSAGSDDDIESAVSELKKVADFLDKYAALMEMKINENEKIVGSFEENDDKQKDKEDDDSHRMFSE